MRQLHALAVAGRLLAVEDEALALFEHGPPAREMPDPELRALKVEQDRRRPMKFLLERANLLDELGLSLLVAVAHVDSEGVGADLHQPADDSGVARRGAERREDLHLARAGGEGFGHPSALTRLI